MLVLNRKNNEEIYIETPEGRITILISDVDGKSARIGIDAPKSFQIYRKELFERVMKENMDSNLHADISRVKKDFLGGFKDDN